MALISERLKYLRKQRGITQDEIAKELNIHRTTYTKYESSRAPDLETLVKIAQLYHMSLDELVGEPFSSCKVSSTSVVREPGRYDDVDLGPLSDDEKRMVLLMRSCMNVNKALYLVKRLAFDEEYMDCFFENDEDMKNSL